MIAVRQPAGRIAELRAKPLSHPSIAARPRVFYWLQFDREEPSMRTWISLLFVASVAATTAIADPRAESIEECFTYADLALVASTLAKHGIARDRAEAMLPDMYELNSEASRDIAQRIVAAAYGPGMKGVGEPKSFASAFGSTCLRMGGRLEAFFGASL